MAQLRAPSTTTRAEVMAEVLKARANGTLITDGELRWSQPTRRRHRLKRADVRAEVLKAQAEGTLTNNSEQRWSLTTAAPSTAGLTRADVRADAAAAMARGERLSQGDTNRNSPAVHTPHDARVQTTVASRDAARRRGSKPA
jgi:hypothetical protein